MNKPTLTGRLRNRGFALVELMITIAIIGILGLVAVPAIFQYIPNFRVNSAAKALASEMSLARMRAISRNAVQHIEFATGSQEIKVWEDVDNNWSTANTLVKTVSLATQFPSVSLGYNVVTGVGGGGPIAQAATFGATATPVRVTFLPNGLTADPGIFYLIPTADRGGRNDRMRAIQVSRAGQVARFRYDGAVNPPWREY